MKMFHAMHRAILDALYETKGPGVLLTIQRTRAQYRAAGKKAWIGRRLKEILKGLP